MDAREAPLTVGVVDGRLVIAVGVDILINALGPEWTQPPYKIVDRALALDEIVRELARGDEDGTTVIHRMLDKAAIDAWENGGEGFDEADDDDAQPSEREEAQP